MKPSTLVVLTGLFVLLSGIGLGTEVAAGTGDVTVQCLTVNKKVIPLYAECGNMWTVNVKLPDLLLVNNGDEPVVPVGVVIRGTAEGDEVVALQVSGELLQDAIKQVNGQVREKLGTDVLGKVADPTLGVDFGEMDFRSTRLSVTATVGPGESALMLVSQLVYVDYTGVEKLDGLSISVAVECGGKTLALPCAVPFTPYACKGKYNFPLGGDCTVVCMPMNVPQHRKALSQEFSFDVLDTSPTVNGVSTGAHAPNPVKLEDYAMFHRPVMAVGDGTVVVVGDKYPDAVQSNPSAITAPQLKKLVLDFAPKLGLTHAIAGNHIVIDHGNGEFSFYGHLAEGSLKVKIGDTVHKADTIAAVGNTGNSTEPHLHFQMMDGPDFLKANSLPVMFEDVPPSTMNQNYKSASTLMASDYIRLRAGK